MEVNTFQHFFFGMGGGEVPFVIDLPSVDLTGVERGKVVKPIAVYFALCYQQVAMLQTHRRDACLARKCAPERK